MNGIQDKRAQKTYPETLLIKVYRSISSPRCNKTVDSPPFDGC
jgi:hypothetical protein